ncbi:hypothetical protein SCAR479_10392 [Seiridium cardinale]|uniref:USP domain-containing protein n=1 Tax=Seiridium cardinale TaxID=138064 RepID=A0ABR2XGS2_9PEZI
MSSAPRPRRPPKLIDTPRYPLVPDDGLPTNGARTLAKYSLLADGWVPDANVFAEKLNPNDDLEALPHIPLNTCYRNALIAALLNVAPFLNFCRRVERQSTPRTAMYERLMQVFEAYRNRFGRTSGRRTTDLARTTAAFWDQLDNQRPPGDNKAEWSVEWSWGEYCQNTGNNVKSGSKGAGGKDNDMHDTNELLNYLFDRLVYAELDIGMEDKTSSPTLLKVIFFRLFSFDLVNRVAFKCCDDAKGMKQRVVGNNGSSGYILEVNFSETQPSLAHAISERFHDDAPLTFNCPLCTTEGYYPSFFKFAYLPEVLMIGANYQADRVDKDGKRIQVADLKASPDITEYLDVSQLRDDPSSPDMSLPKGKVEGLYRLDAVVGFPRIALDKGGHYIAWVRRDRDVWDRVNDVAGVKPRRMTMEDWLNEINFRPRLLFYVRDRELDLKDLDAMKTTVVSAPAAGGSSSGGTTGPSGGTKGSSRGTAGPSGGTKGSSRGTAGSSGGITGSSGGNTGSSGGNTGSSGVPRPPPVSPVPPVPPVPRSSRPTMSAEQKKKEMEEAAQRQAKRDAERIKHQGRIRRTAPVPPAGAKPSAPSKPKTPSPSPPTRSTPKSGRRKGEMRAEYKLRLAREEKIEEIKERARVAAEEMQARSEWDKRQALMKSQFGTSKPTGGSSNPSGPTTTPGRGGSTVQRGPAASRALKAPTVPGMVGPKAPKGPPRPPPPPRCPWTIDPDPEDPRIDASAGWDIARFRREFAVEGLNPPPGRNPNVQFWRDIWANHFNLDIRNYDAYSIQKLKAAADEAGIEVKPKPFRNAVKKDYINACKRADQTRLWEYKVHGGPAPNIRGGGGGDDSEEGSHSSDSDSSSKSLTPPPKTDRRKRNYDSDDGYGDDDRHAGRKRPNRGDEVTKRPKRSSSPPPRQQPSSAPKLSAYKRGYRFHRSSERSVKIESPSPSPRPKSSSAKIKQESSSPKSPAKFPGNPARSSPGTDQSAPEDTDSQYDDDDDVSIRFLGLFPDPNETGLEVESSSDSDSGLDFIEWSKKNSRTLWGTRPDPLKQTSAQKSEKADKQPAQQAKSSAQKGKNTGKQPAAQDSASEYSEDE